MTSSTEWSVEAIIAALEAVLDDADQPPEDAGRYLLEHPSEVAEALRAERRARADEGEFVDSYHEL